MNIQSLYWVGASVPPDLAFVLAKLGDLDLSIGDRRAALLELLSSPSVVARSLALDFFSLAISNQRYGNMSIIDDSVADAVRAAALLELAAPPYERTESGAEPRRAANHASALSALEHNADPADASLLARVLNVNDDPDVLGIGVGAAEPVLRNEPAHTELVNMLSQISRRRELDPNTRAGAITAIGGADDEGVTPLLVANLTDPELAVSAAAARALLERDFVGHRSLVASIAATWPTIEFPPFDVQEVRQLLEDAGVS